MVSHHRQQLAYWEEQLRQANIHDRKPGICRVTGAAHVTVTFHSAPPDERRVCVDCKACFPINVDLLTPIDLTHTDPFPAVCRERAFFMRCGRPIANFL
jgi:hypothetical protein